MSEQLPEMKWVETRAVGGGARSAAWNQIKADVLNVPYQRLQRAEFGAWGSALIAGKAAGLFDDLAAAAAQSALPQGNPIQPNAANRSVYDSLVEKYIAMQAMLEKHFSGEALQ
jgi:xylulokinase